MKIQQQIVDSLTPVLPGPHAVEVSLGLEIYFVVEGDHDEDGQPEGEAGRHDGVGVVHDEPALLGVVILVLDVLMGCVPSLYCYIKCCIVAVSSDNNFCVHITTYKYLPSEQYGEEGDAGGGEPGQEDHQHGGPHRDGRVVHQRLGDGVVSAEIVNNAWSFVRYLVVRRRR